MGTRGLGGRRRITWPVMALEASDVALLRGGLASILEALELSRRTVRTIRQNLFWAFAYNVVAIPLAAGALYPSLGILLHPTIASAAMALSSVSVVGNSLRLGSLARGGLSPWKPRALLC